MNWLTAAGSALVGIGVAGYATGVVSPYAGAGFAVTAVMVGITLIAIRRAEAGGTE